MMLVSVISYIDRSTLAVLIPSIMRDTGMTATQYGWIVSGFSFGYMAGNPLWGIVLDRAGLRLGMLAAVSLWTLASVSHALLAGAAGFLIARIILGFGEGATFPGALRTCVQTLDPASRGRGIALSYSGGSLGAIITPFIVTPIYLHYGWRAAFWFTGFVGAAWLLWWLFISRRVDIQRPPDSTAARPRISFRDSRIWAFIAIYSLGTVPLAFVVNMTSVFLTRKFGLTQAELGHLLWIPPLGWELGYFFWGWHLDRRLRAAPSTAALGVYAGIFLLGLALVLPFAAVFASSSLPLTLALFFTTMFAVGSFIIPAVSYATVAFGERQSGLIGGLGAGSFSASAFVLSPIFGKLLDQQAYHVAFPLAAACPIAGLLLWRFLSARSA